MGMYINECSVAMQTVFLLRKMSEHTSKFSREIQNGILLEKKFII